ncbi:CotD family spore coat protein [Rummeliibacillus sp. SL167]|uniref:CotD family spore coat protein n=1 Tax=Rummeliibacillus sp. SL167 TaxID=2579792 RepID=UPI00351AA67E
MNSKYHDHSFGGRGHQGMSAHCFPHQTSPAEFCPPQTSPAQFDPARVSPTRQYVRTNIINTVVPHIHPSHTTTVNRHVINNQHYFPHTESVVNEYVETNTMCGKPHNGCCPPHHWGRR